jgi:NTP pyrophosphatase (non-canonical NTP hydrolase)
MGYLQGYDHDSNGSAREMLHELDRARKKFPKNEKPLAALMEETGEVARALLQGASREDIYAECMQVAALAIRIAEEGDSDFDHTKTWNKAK